MMPPDPRSAEERASRRRATRTKKFVGLLTCCVAIVIGVAIAVAVVQPWATGATQPTQPMRYLGLHEPDAPGSYTGVNEFARAVGKQPNLVSYYSPWPKPFQVGYANLAAKHGALTLIQMDPTNVSLATIANGRYDLYLRTFATAVKLFRARIVLSFGHEMNGDWYSWGYQHTPPRVFVAAWRHIVNVFRSAGAENVTWLWTVNVVVKDLPIHIPDPAPWWPGRSYVDWVGIDGYYYLPHSSFAQIFGPTIVAVRALTRDPILIAETGAAMAAGQPAKINDLFLGIHAYGLLGFLWFDENVQGRAWRINSSQAFAMFRRDAKTFLRPSATPASQHSSSNSPSP
jgi:mannan endo-1,4-beta-mannosidase